MFEHKNNSPELHTETPEESFESRPQLTSVRIRETSGQIFFIAALISLIIALAASAYLFFQKKSLIATIESQTQEKQTKLAAYNSDQNKFLLAQADSILGKVKIISTSLNERIRWSKILEIISQESFRGVKYNSITANSDRTITLTGEVNTYENFGKAVRAWESSEYLEKVEIGSFSKSSNEEKISLNFSLTLTIKPEVFGTTAEKSDVATP